MTELFKKLNLKNHREVTVMNAPESFEEELTALTRDTTVRVNRAPGAANSVEFALAFATTRAELARISKALLRAACGDAIIWIAYPKGTSTRYTCEFNRDSGFDVLRGAGFDTVRQVAVDDDWSALRFRRTEHIGS